MSAAKVSMSCRVFEEILADLDRSEVLPAAMREAALGHAETCPECGLLLTESESLEMRFESIREMVRGLSAPTRIETSLLKEFREIRASEHRGKLRWRVAALGAAAAVALAVGLALNGDNLLWQGTRHEPNAKNVVSAPVPAQTQDVLPSPARTEASTSERITHEPAIRKVKADRPALQAKPPMASPAAEEAAFVRLPYADSSVEIEGGEVVRVILSPAALESLGVQTGAIGSNEDVSADLLLDEDGTPEAIRLVAQADGGSIPN